MKKIVITLMCLLGTSRWLQAEPDTAALAEELANTLSAVQTVRLEGVWQIEFEMEGMKQKTEMPMKLVFERPNRLSLTSQQSQVMCDGQHLVQRMPMLKQYQTSALGEDGLAGALEDSLMGASLVSSPLAKARASWSRWWPACRDPRRGSPLRRGSIKPPGFCAKLNWIEMRWRRP